MANRRVCCCVGVCRETRNWLPHCHFRGLRRDSVVVVVVVDDDDVEEGTHVVVDDDEHSHGHEYDVVPLEAVASILVSPVEVA